MQKGKEYEPKSACNEEALGVWGAKLHVRIAHAAEMYQQTYYAKSID